MRSSDNGRPVNKFKREVPVNRTVPLTGTECIWFLCFFLVSLFFPLTFFPLFPLSFTFHFSFNCFLVSVSLFSLFLSSISRMYSSSFSKHSLSELVLVILSLFSFLAFCFTFSYFFLSISLGLYSFFLFSFLSFSP